MKLPDIPTKLSLLGLWGFVMYEREQQRQELAALKGDMMAKFEDVKGLVRAIGFETDRLAMELERLKTLATAGMTPDQEDEVQASLQASIDRLHALGQSEADPIPDPVEPGESV